MASGAMPCSLAGIRVLDLTDNHTAYTAKLLADLGADVIRISPPSGDPLQAASPHFAGSDGKEVSAVQAFLNAGKKSVSLDLTMSEGLALFLALAGRSDVIVESFLPGKLQRLGAGYDAIKAVNSRAILVSVSAFGQTGPRADYCASDLTLLAAGGLMSLGGYADTSPMTIPGGQGYYASAIFATVAVLSTLLERESTGVGRWVDVSGQECIAFALEDAIPEWYLNGNVRQRYGERAREAGSGVYPCKDGYISMIAGRLGTASAFIALTEWIAASGTRGGEELLDEKWRDFKYRQSKEGIDRFEAIFREFCASRTKKELYRQGQEKQIAIAPVNTIADVCESEQLQAVGFLKTRQDAISGRALTFPGPPFRLSASPAIMRSTAPSHGAHNDDVFGGLLGLTDAKRAALRTAGVV